jgi:hypothetical protein
MDQQLPRLQLQRHRSLYGQVRVPLGPRSYAFLSSALVSNYVPKLTPCLIFYALTQEVNCSPLASCRPTSSLSGARKAESGLLAGDGRVEMPC